MSILRFSNLSFNYRFRPLSFIPNNYHQIHYYSNYSNYNSYSKSSLIHSKISLNSFPFANHIFMKSFNQNTLLPRFYVSQPDSDDQPPPKNLKNLVKEYGRIAIFVYLCCSFTSFIICFLIVWKFDLNFQTLANLKSKLFGSNSIENSNPNPNPSKSNNSSSLNSDLFTQLLVSMAFTKLLLPIKLGLTALLTPILARRLRSLGWDIGGKSMRTLGKELKAEMKEKIRKDS